MTEPTPEATPVATPNGLVMCLVYNECHDKNPDYQSTLCQSCQRNLYAPSKTFDYYAGYQQKRDAIMRLLQEQIDKLPNTVLSSGKTVVFVVNLEKIVINNVAVIDHLKEALDKLQQAIEHANQACVVLSPLVQTHGAQ